MELNPHHMIGLYKILEDELPELVASSGYFKNFGPYSIQCGFHGYLP